MEYEKIYILNPAYYLRNDMYRSIIASYVYIDFDAKMYENNFLSIIHPINAQFLSFFNGSRTLLKCINDLSIYFDLTEEEVSEIIAPYIENEDRIHIQYNDIYFTFPKKVLIEKRNHIRRELYNPQQFDIGANNIDLISSRLYKPVQAVFELTLRCYTDCIYCYADRSQENIKKNMPLNRMLSIIREAKELGIADLHINGGEVLMHPNYKEILKELSYNGYYPLISTKIPLRKDVLIFLKEIGMTLLQISLDSQVPATLMNLLHVNVQYKNDIYKTMQMVDEMGFQWQVNSIITSLNCDLETDIKPLLSKLLSFKNIREIRMSTAAFSFYKSQENYDKLKISSIEFDRVEQYLSLYSLDYPHIRIITSNNNEISPPRTKEDFDQRALCTANQKSFVILPDGKVTLCEELYWHPSFIIGDLYKQSIMEMWMSKKATNLFFLQRKMISKESSCYVCEDFEQCRHHKGVCWKMVLTAYGKTKWDYPDPRCPNCQINKN